MTPDDFCAKVMRIVEQVVKDLWRSQPLTENELDTITDRILLLKEEEQSK